MTAVRTMGSASPASPCGCAPCAETSAAERAGLERTRFFARQLVGPDDLTQDQLYFREKARRHNRLLHGWGVVCGACVRLGQTPCTVVVEPGYILGPYGDEIVIPEEVPLDVCRLGGGERTGCCGEDLDPWCADARSDCPDGTLYLAVRYAECQARPVRATGSECGCGCDESRCEYSRIRDSYALALLRELPPPYTTPMRQPSILELLPCIRPDVARGCPPCPPQPWVILADISVDRSCRVRAVNCHTHRRYVFSTATFYFTCALPGFTTGVQPPTSQPGQLPGRVAGRAISALTGGGELIDLGATLVEEPPRAIVALRRAGGGSVMLPAYFLVQAGETVSELLAREGERTYYDPGADDTVTLRELYAAAGVAGDVPLAGAAAALAPLEGMVLDLGALRSARPSLAELVGPEGLERLDRDFQGAPARAVELPASTLVGVVPDSPLARHVASMTVREVAEAGEEEFVAGARAAAPARRKEAAAQQARAVWQAARRVAELGGSGPGAGSG